MGKLWFPFVDRVVHKQTSVYVKGKNEQNRSELTPSETQRKSDYLSASWFGACFLVNVPANATVSFSGEQ